MKKKHEFSHESKSEVKAVTEPIISASEHQKNANTHINLNKNALIAGVLNLVLVGLGYAFLKQYKKALLAFIGYIAIYFAIFYVSTFYPVLMWVGIPITLAFAYDAYKTGKKLS